MNCFSFGRQRAIIVNKILDVNGGAHTDPV